MSNKQPSSNNTRGHEFSLDDHKTLRSLPHLNGGKWSLVYDRYEEEKLPQIEALCVLGNGIFTTRGAAEEAYADGKHYPATYFAGAYNRLDSDLEGKVVSNESIVNFPNWLPITWRCEGEEEWFSIADKGSNIVSFRLELDLYNGILKRKMRVYDSAGREFDIESRRFVNMHTENPHSAGIKYSITPVSYSGKLQVRSSLDGSVENNGVARYHGLGSKHLIVEDIGVTEKSDAMFIHVKTNQSHVEVCEAARTQIFANNKLCNHVKKEDIVEDEQVHQIFTFRVEEGKTVTIEKLVCLFSNMDKGVLEAKEAALDRIQWMPQYSELESTHCVTWNVVWDNIDVFIKGNEATARLQVIVRLHMFHLLQTVSLNSIGYDVGVPARGLHGEAYRGHIFWDELFILPFFTIHAPELVKTLIRYRYYRLHTARHSAQLSGFQGAMFPWQSGSDGREESATVHYNPLDKTWGPDLSALQRHVNIAIAYIVLRFYDSTKDGFFMEQYGAELVVEICRFWASASTYNHETDRYEIKGVMGPDEFHEKYPNAEKAGIDNNTYTNVMVVWLLKKALHIVTMPVMRDEYRKRLLHLLRIKREELELWEDISKKMTIPIHADGLVWSQFQGYEELQDLDFEAYRKKYKNIERMDRILKAEGDSPDNYKVSKQADVCMLFYLLTKQELEDVFTGLGYKFSESMIKANIEYYLQRTTHGSTLSKMVFSYVLQDYDRKQAWDLFVDSARADIDDVQLGTTGEGVHLALMAGTLYTCIRKFAGIDLSQSVMEISPEMPESISKMKFNLQFRGVVVTSSITHSRVKAAASQNMFPINVQGTIMFPFGGAFRKKIHNQPLSKNNGAICKHCSCSMQDDENTCCRVCGKYVCDDCFVQHTGWCDVLKLDISLKLCKDCSTTLELSTLSPTTWIPRSVKSRRTSATAAAVAKATSASSAPEERGKEGLVETSLQQAN